jgi:hypothetical protein
MKPNLFLLAHQESLNREYLQREGGLKKRGITLVGANHFLIHRTAEKWWKAVERARDMHLRARNMRVRRRPGKN